MSSFRFQYFTKRKSAWFYHQRNAGHAGGGGGGNSQGFLLGAPIILIDYDISRYVKGSPIWKMHMTYCRYGTFRVHGWSFSVALANKLCKIRKEGRELWVRL